MEPIATQIQTFLDGGRKLKLATVEDVRMDNGYRIRSFASLVKKIANLSFFNPTFELMYRGQSEDYRDRADEPKTTILPSIYRTSGYFTQGLAKERFDLLEKAEEALCLKASFKGKERVTRYRVLQWALLQHYEVVPTPLLDVTHSLRVACSFSKMGHESEETYLYVLGIPYLSGCITTSGDQGIQALRLLSVCPPQSLRPHYQEGYLLGEYPDANYHTNKRYSKAEWDFGQRLICKFILPPSDQLWVDGFDAFRDEVIYPDDDPIKDLADEVKKAL